MPGTFGKATGVFFAPWAYAAGRMLKRPQLSQYALQLDEDFSRGYSDILRQRGQAGDIMGGYLIAAKLSALAGKGADEVIKEYFSRSHAQLLQDLVCVLAHNKKRDGFFVEVGVGNGTHLSNTLLLERDFGWTGILAEPNRAFQPAIRAARTAVLDTRAVYDASGQTMQLEAVEGVGELSGLGAHRTVRGDQKLSVYDVETVTLDDLLNQHSAPAEIDFISVDTEGSEVQVLNGLDLTRRRVNFFAIEHNFDAPRLEKIRKILAPHGYREIFREASMFDAWFVHPQLASPYLG